MPKTRKADARAVCVACSNALDQFMTEYGHLPLPTGAVMGKDGDFDTSVHSGLVAILLGLDRQENPGGLNFLGDFREARVEDEQMIGGLYLQDTRAALFDPWGRPYRVRLDLDGDGRLANPQSDAPHSMISTTILVWSAGKDGDFATWHDNTGSWEWTR